MIKITEKLFAHINNDAFLLGTFQLQSELFENTIGYLNQYLDKQGANVPLNVRKLQQACSRLLAYETKITLSSSSLPALAKDIYQDIAKLDKDDYILLPGGWAGSPGHGMVYQFKINAEGDLLFLINNSGDGLQYHARKSHHEKELYNPVLTYKIPKAQIRNGVMFQAILVQLLETLDSRLQKDEPVNAKYLYEKVFAAFSYLDGEIVHTAENEFDQGYTAGQISGTCAQRSLHQMLKSQFSDIDEYRRFIYGFKAYALDDYITTLTSKKQHDAPQLQGQIDKAIRHQLRLLNLEKVKAPEALFDAKFKQKEVAKLTQYLTQMSGHKRLEMRALPLEEDSPAFDFEITFPATRAANTDAALRRLRIDHTPLRVVTGGENLLEEMDGLLAHCRKLEQSQQHQNIFEQTEHFFLNLPLPQNTINEPLLSYYAGIDTEEKAFLFYNKVNQLQALYFDSFDALISNQVSLPRMYLAKLVLFTVVGHINSTFTISKTECFYELISGTVSSLLFSIKAVYLAQYDPKLDLMLQQLYDLYSKTKKKDIKEGQNIKYYQSLLDNYPALVSILRDKYIEAYAHENNDLHKALKRDQCQDIFYLLAHRDELSHDEQFNGILKQIALQKEMEMAYSHYLARLVEPEEYQHPEECQHIESEIKITFNMLKGGLNVESPFSLNNKKFKIKAKLSNAKFSLDSRTPVSYAFAIDLQNLFVPENDIQLIPGEKLLEYRNPKLFNRVIEPQDLEERELFLLRKNVDFQAPLTLGYFSQHIEKVERREIQIYIEANLFQSGVLLRVLKPAFFKEFDHFIQVGMTHFEQKNQLSVTSLFFLRLSLLVNQYLRQMDSVLYRSRLIEFTQLLSQLLETHTDPNIKASLHQYRFLAGVMLLQHGITEDALWKDTLISYFYTQAYVNPDELLDTDTQFKIKCTTHAWKRILAAHAKVWPLQEMIPLILSSTNVHLNQALGEVLNMYPLFLISKEGGQGISDYRVDFESGLVFKQKMAFGAMPLAILQHPVLKRFGFDHLNSCFISPDENHFLVVQPAIALEFIKHDKGFDVKATGINPENKLAVYDLYALSDAVASLWKLPYAGWMGEHHERLPMILRERDNLCWLNANTKQDLCITNAQNQIMVKGELDENAWRITEAGHPITVPTAWMHKQLAAIESPAFLMITELEQDNYRARLPRYGLSFTIQPNMKIAFHWNGATYWYQKENQPIGPRVSQMTFVNDKRALCVLPIQRFFNSGKREVTGEYYAYIQDTQAQIPARSLKQQFNKSPDEQIWQYSGTEFYMVLGVRDNHLVAQTPSEALYLSYLYLGSNQPEKAWETLADCDRRLGGLVGAYDELRYINWICNSLPHKISQKSEENEPLMTPSVVACQLKSLSLLVAFLEKGKSIDFPLLDEPSNDNERYEMLCLTENEVFFDNLNETIYALFSKLQALRRELPALFSLSEYERKHLLNFYHDTLPEDNQLLGALGYEWAELKLTQLRKELSSLDAKAQMGVLSKFEKQRRQAIDKFIKEHNGVAKVRSDLEYRPIDLSLPADLTYKYELKGLITDDAKLLNKIGLVSNLSLEHLNPGVTQEDFLKNFTHYLAIASDLRHPDRKALTQFCKATLITHRHGASSKHPNVIPQLCKVLYRLISAPSISLQGIDTYTKLLKYTKNLPTPPEILVPQYVNKTDSLLISMQALWQKTLAPRKKGMPLMADSIHNGLFVTEPLIYAKYCKEWRALDQVFRTGRESSGALAQLPDAQVAEAQAGQVKFQALQQLRRLALTIVEAEGALLSLEESCNARLSDLMKEQDHLESDVIRLANEGPENVDAKLVWDIDMASGKRAALDMRNLLTLYFHADSIRYQTETGLSVEKINQLHGLLAQYLAHTLPLQQLSRVLKHIQEDLPLASDEGEKELIVFQIAEALFSENIVSVTREPALTVFQYYEGILLRPQQKEALSRLLTSKESVEKMIMGGGKSKVILPALAQQKASGDNLVIIEVPRSLLHTNYVDLKAISAQLFAQNAVLFEFSRETDCSSKRLKKIYDQLIDVMVDKNYLVTTGDALQSVELKYLELLLKRPEFSTDENAMKTLYEWEQQIVGLEKLVLLLRNHGELIIDEVHQGLLLNHKLNYTIGQSSRVSSVIIRHVIKLYKFLQYVDLPSGVTLSAVVKNNQLLTDEDFERIPELLADQLINHPNSPLSEWVSAQKNTPTFKAELRDFLLDDSKSEPAFIATKCTGHLPLNSYRELVVNLLRYALRRNYNEHYGPSKLTTRTPQSSALAIPYESNNKPKERSRFGEYLETVVYTIQGLLISGLSKPLLKDFLEGLQVQAKNELHKKSASNLDATTAAQLFNSLTSVLNISFSQLDLKNEEQLTRLQQHLSHHEDLIYELLQSEILKLIPVDSDVLSSNAYDHVSLVKSCQGLTATPWNASTFHSRLAYDAAVALGTDGYIVEGIKAKQPTIQVASFTSTPEYLKNILASYGAKDEVRAIIDLNASFKGIDNVTVAKEIAQYIRDNPQQFSPTEPIGYILFFNNANQLCALSTDKSQLDSEPLVLDSSNVKLINERLNSLPKGRFTFYDQSHTVGTDIKQSSQARGIVLIDKDTHLSSFLQGVMRLRGLLEGNQHLELVVPETFAGKNLDEILKLMALQEQEQLMQDNFEAARLKMKNVIRDYFLQYLLALPEEKVLQKYNLLQSFKKYFIEHKEDNFAGATFRLTQAMDPKTILSNRAKALLSDWKFIMKSAQQPIYAEDEQRIARQLGQIIDAASMPGVCKKEERVNAQEGHTEVEVEVENQVQHEVKVEKQIQVETSEPSRAGALYLPWLTLNDLSRSSLQGKTLSEICQSVGTSEVASFSSAIFASKNFYLTYQNQTHYLDRFMKPVHALLFTYTGDALTCTILSPQESEDVLRLVDSINQAGQTESSYWIGTTQHTVLAGNPLANFKENKTYRTVIEQIRYFNGEFRLLVGGDSPLSWLGEASAQKMKFFETYLAPFREVQFSEIEQLTNILSSQAKGFQFIANHPSRDLCDYDWALNFPDSSADNIAEYQQLARAFKAITDTWVEEHYQKIAKESDLSLRARTYLQNYIEQKKYTKQIIAKLAEKDALTYLARPLGEILQQLNVKEIEKYVSSLTAVLPGNTRTKTASEIEFLNYQFLRELLALNNPEESTLILFGLIAPNRFIGAVELENIFTHLRQAHDRSGPGLTEAQQKIMIRLLANESALITREHFDYLFEMSPGTPAFLDAITSHRHLQASDLQKLLVNLQTERDAYILHSLVARGYDEAVSAYLLKHEHPNAEVLTAIVRKTQKSSVLRAVIPRLPTALMKDALLNPILKEDDLVALIAEEPEKVCAFILNKEGVSTRLLQAIAAYTKEDKVFRQVLSRAKGETQILEKVILNPNLPKVILLELIRKNEGLIQVLKQTNVPPEILSLIAGTSNNGEVLEYLATHYKEPKIVEKLAANSRLPEERLLAFIKNEAAFPVCLAILRRGYNTDRTLEAIAEYATNSETLKQISQKKPGTLVLDKLLSNPHVDDDVLIALVEAGEVARVSETVLRRHNPSPALLKIMVEETQEPASLEALVRGANSAEIFEAWLLNDYQSDEQLLAFMNAEKQNEISSLILKRTKLTILILQAIAQKTTDIQVFRQVIAQSSYQGKLGDLLSKCKDKEAMLLALIALEPETKICSALLKTEGLSLNILLAIVGKTTAAKELQTIMRQSRSPEVFTAVLANPALNQDILVELINLGQETSVYTFVSKDPARWTEVLKKIGRETKDHTLALALIENTQDLGVVEAALSNPNLSDEILKDLHLKTISKNPNLSEDILVDIIKKTKDINVLQAAGAHRNAAERTRLAAQHHDLSIYKTIDDVLAIVAEKRDALKKIAESNSKYKEVSDEADLLHQALAGAVTKFKAAIISKESLDAFKDDCIKIIGDDKVQKSFKSHRGAWQRLPAVLKWFLGFLATVTIVPALGVALFSPHRYAGTFFKPPATKSSKQLDEIKDKFEGLKLPGNRD